MKCLKDHSNGLRVASETYINLASRHGRKVWDSALINQSVEWAWCGYQGVPHPPLEVGFSYSNKLKGILFLLCCLY